MILFDTHFIPLQNEPSPILLRPKLMEEIYFECQKTSFFRRAVVLLSLLKKVGSARLRENVVHPISPKTPATQYQPIDRKKRKGKRVEDYSRDRAV